MYTFHVQNLSAFLSFVTNYYYELQSTSLLHKSVVILLESVIYITLYETHEIFANKLPLRQKFQGHRLVRVFWVGAVQGESQSRVRSVMSNSSDANSSGQGSGLQGMSSGDWVAGMKKKTISQRMGDFIQMVSEISPARRRQVGAGVYLLLASEIWMGKREGGRKSRPTNGDPAHVACARRHGSLKFGSPRLGDML